MRFLYVHKQCFMHLLITLHEFLTSMVGGVKGSYCRHHGIYTADIATTADLVVSILSPVFTPGVLYDPIRFLLQPNGRKSSCAISHQQHSVIQMLSTYVWARDTPNICLHIRGVDANCNNNTLTGLLIQTHSTCKTELELTRERAMFHKISSNLVFI